MSQNLLDYIKKSKDGAMTEDQIRQELLKAGWQIAEIEEGLKTGGAASPVAPAVPVVEDKNTKISSPVKMILIVVLALLLIGGSVFGFYALDKQMGWGVLNQNQKAVEQKQQVQEDVGVVENSEKGKAISEEEALKQLIKCKKTFLIYNPYANTTDLVLCHAKVFEQGYEGGKDLCSRLENLNDLGSGFCYAGMAVAKNDENICKEKSGDPYTSSICEAIIAAKNNKGTPKDQLSACEDPGCFSYIFKEKGFDGSLCSEMETPDIQSTCYYGLALAKLDETLCSKVDLKNIYSSSEDGFKSLCYYTVAAAKKDASLCDKAVDQKLFADNESCYAAVAVSTNNSDLCEKVSGSSSLFCFISVAAGSEDESLCAKAPQSNCYSLVAQTKEDESLCKEDGLCYEDLAVLKLDENLCEKAGYNARSCYSLLEELKDDKNLCEKSGTSKDNCYPAELIKE